MEITDKKLLTILEALKSDLNSAYQTSFKDFKDQYIQKASGKVDVLIELLKL